MGKRRSPENDHVVATRFFVIGSVVLGFAMLIAGAGFFIRNLSADQRIVLCWACSLAAGFAAGSFAGSAYLSYQVNSSKLGNVLVVTTSGFAVWLITFYFLYQTIGPQPTSVSVAISDSLTSEPIEREFVVTFKDRSVGEYRSERCLGSPSPLHSWPANDIIVANVDCRGYKFAESAAIGPDSLQLTMTRTDQFPYVIQPKLNSVLDSATLRLADLPTLNVVNDALEGSQPNELPENVVFTCRNATDRHVDVLLWHYPPDGGRRDGLFFSIQQINGCPIPPGKQGTFSQFSLTPGYFLVFVSWHGREAMLVSHGNLYKSSTPTLKLETFGNNKEGIKGYLSYSN